MPNEDNYHMLNEAGIYYFHLKPDDQPPAGWIKFAYKRFYIPRQVENATGYIACRHPSEALKLINRWQHIGKWQYKLDI